MLPTPPDNSRTILLIGASRGLGLRMAAEFLSKGWHVVGTVQESARTGLHDLADRYPGRVKIETLDVTEPGQIAALRDRLAGRGFDVLLAPPTGTRATPSPTSRRKSSCA